MGLFLIRNLDVEQITIADRNACHCFCKPGPMIHTQPKPVKSRATLRQLSSTVPCTILTMLWKYGINNNTRIQRIMSTIRNILAVMIVIGLNSCETNPGINSGSSIESFCIALPSNWTCEIYHHSFDTLPLPLTKEGRMEDPIAIIQYTNRSTECTSSQPLWLQVYDISKKGTLETIIDDSQIHSWCIPMFFGENDSYYVITSPCYLYSSCLTNDSIINPLLQSLKRLFSNSIID